MFGMIMDTPKIIIAPDSFKGTLSARQVCQIWEKAFSQAFPEARTVLLPMSDGGEGALECIFSATGASPVQAMVEGPLGAPVMAEAALFNEGRSAFIESAAACGLGLVPPGSRDPMKTSSYGAGQMIAAVLKAGAVDITVAIGGSATVDGGAGMLQALGVSLKDSDGREIPRGGAGLARIASVDAGGLNPLARKASFRIAGDVKNPLLGPDGAAAVFGPQKGATASTIPLLEKGLANFAGCAIASGLADDCRHPGDGAAGGMGFALRCFLGASFRSGAELIAELTGFRRHLEGASLLITGEGRTDRQTAFGKLPAVLAGMARQCGVPVVLCSGAIEDADSLTGVFDAMFSTVQAVRPLEAVLADAASSLETTARSMASLLRMGFSAKV